MVPKARLNLFTERDADLQIRAREIL